MDSRVPGLLGGLLLLACRPAAGPPEHPDDPITGRTPARAAPDSEGDAIEPKPRNQGPGMAYIEARKIALARDAIPCPDACARGEARTRCTVSADIRFVDLLAEASHQQVREILEHSPGIDRCFAQVADPKAKLLPSFRIPLDFVIGPRGELQAREDPLHAADPELEQMLACVGSWLDGLSFAASGRSLSTRVRLSVEPTGHCTE